MQTTSLKVIAALALTLAGAASQAAEPVLPGTRICRGPLFAQTNLNAFGRATNAYGGNAVAHFTVKRDTYYDGPFNDIYTQDASSFYFTANYPSFYLPGWFKACARNNGSSTIYVDLQLSGY